MIEAMLNAAKLAAALSNDRDTIIIILDEHGFLIRGTTRIGQFTYEATLDLPAPAFINHPALLENSVHLILSQLIKRQEAENGRG